jgi:hypothetical protein
VTRRRRPVPGELLLHPWILLAAATIAANDLWIRPRWPGVISGKLSDCGINFLLPVVLLAVAEWIGFAARAARGAPFRVPGPVAVALCCLASATYFTLLKTWPPFSAVHAQLLGALAGPLAGTRRFVNTVDPTDLWTLAVTPLAGWFLWRASQRRSGGLTRPRGPAAACPRTPAMRPPRPPEW